MIKMQKRIQDNIVFVLGTVLVAVLIAIGQDALPSQTALGSTATSASSSAQSAQQQSATQTQQGTGAASQPSGLGPPPVIRIGEGGEGSLDD